VKPNGLIKTITILLLLCAIFVSCLSTTFSGYTTASSNNVGIVPDSEKILVHLVPDTASINGECIVNSITVKKNTNISNNNAFVLFSGNIIQNNWKISLTFGTASQDIYLLYFEPGTSIQLSSGKSISMSGFYTIRSGNSATNLFDMDIQACSDVITTCKQFGIPLKYNFIV
jgi:hypothetical protein